MRYYCVKQHDITDCGAACLATICKQNDYKIGITRIREVAGTDKQGTNVYGIIKAAETLGFSAKGVKGDKEAFFSEFHLLFENFLISQEVLVLHSTDILVVFPPYEHLQRTSLV